MKQLLRLSAITGLAFVTLCGLTALALGRINGALSSPLLSGALPPTVHIIPFFSFGLKGFEPASAPGGFGALIGSESALYGSTISGGSKTCSTRFDTGSETGCGVVYRLTPGVGKRYKIQILHVFEGAPSDGAASFGTLVADKDGNLYGTTYYGGTYDGGTVFELHPSSSGYTEAIVHSFGYGQDGAYPISGVIEVGRTLYGTTLGGGSYSSQVCANYAGVSTCGTLYNLNPATGTEHVLHSFGQVGDGSSPFAAPLDVGDTLFGTTDLGGTTNLCGTVFSTRKNGRDERVVHSFLNAGRGDGCNPFASLIDVNGTLYGTTASGGGNFCPHCEGTLFSLDPTTGKEEVLHKFGNSGDGSEPRGSLIDVSGVLYGTTGIGGSGCGSLGCGVIFSLVPSSSPLYNVLYRFQGGADGGSPESALLYSHRALYGTTTLGGKKGYGTATKIRM